MRNQKERIAEYTEYIKNKNNRLDNIIVCAVQTIRVREKETEKVKTDTKESKRYGDAKFVNETYVNS